MSLRRTVVVAGLLIGFVLVASTGGNLWAGDTGEVKGLSAKVELDKKVAALFTVKKATYDAAKNETTLLLECQKDLTETVKARLGVYQKKNPLGASFLDEDKVKLEAKIATRIDGAIGAKQGDRIRLVVPMPAKDSVARVKTVRVDAGSAID